jgi:hypothetical protein
MWQTTATATTPAGRAAVFARYADAGSWPTWDTEVEWVSHDGPFTAGTTGRLKPKGGPTTKFTIVSLETDRAFQDVTRLPGARLVFDHVLTDQPGGGTAITHTVSITGPMTFLFSRVIGRNIARGLPATVSALAQLAAADESAPAR